MRAKNRQNALGLQSVFPAFKKLDPQDLYIFVQAILSSSVIRIQIREKLLGPRWSNWYKASDEAVACVILILLLTHYEAGTSGGGVRVQQHSDETPHRRYWRPGNMLIVCASQIYPSSRGLDLRTSVYT